MSECATSDPMVEVVFAWGDDDTLVLGPDCPGDAGYWYADVGLPAWANRLTTAPPSAWVPGNLLLAVTRDSGTMPLTVAAAGTDTATLETQKALLEAALNAWPATVTIRITDPGGSPVDLGPWEYQPALPAWGPITPLDAGMYAASSAVTLTVNPPGSP